MEARPPDRARPDAGVGTREAHPSRGVRPLAQRARTGRDDLPREPFEGTAPSRKVNGSCVRPSVREETQGQAPVRTDGRTRTDTPAPKLTARQAGALAALDVMGSLGPAALGTQLGIDRNRAHDVLRQLSALGITAPVGDGTYALALTTHDQTISRETDR